jgi:hypothetical protein
MTPQVRTFRLGYLLIALQFIVPAVGYAIDPQSAVDTVQRLNRALGGTAWQESGHLWNMLAFGNVMTLGFLCMLIRSDVERFLPALPALLFLKACSALFSLFIATARDIPAFYAIFLLDSVTTIAMGILALRAAHSLAADRSAPWWARWLLVDPARIEQTLVRVPASWARPNLWQVFLGACAMWQRILFRTETIGTSRTARVRDTWRARLLAFRVVRLPVLLACRAVAPLDPLGLASTKDRIIHHLLTAHHDGDQFSYDVELLALYPGAVDELRALVRAVVDGTHPRARWWRDLCVFDGYHEALLAALDGAQRRATEDPDATLRATLAWCAAQPPTPAATLRAWRAGALRLRFV